MQQNKMSVIQLTIITAVNMVGSGIVMLPTQLAQVGTMSTLAWIFTVAGALCISYVFARCGMFSKETSGGIGSYSNYAYGKQGNFVTNFTYAISLVVANVAIAVSAVGYCEVLLNINLSAVMVAVWTIILLIGTMAANFWGPKITGKIGAVTVWGIIIPVGFLAVAGWFWFQPTTYAVAWNPHHLSLFAGISKALPITIWGLLGMESAAANADAVDNPQKNVPIAVLGGTSAAALIYILSTNVMQGICHNSALAKSNAPYGLVFAEMFNPFIGKLVMTLMIIACIGSLLGWQFTVAEVFRSGAKEGYFPRLFKVANKFTAPYYGMLLILVVQFLLSLMTISPDLNSQFQNLVNLAVVTNIIPFVMCMGAVKNIQLKAGVDRKSKSYLLTNIVSLLANIYILYAMYACGFQSLALGSMVTYIGWIIYGFISYKYDLD